MLKDKIRVGVWTVEHGFETMAREYSNYASAKEAASQYHIFEQRNYGPNETYFFVDLGGVRTYTTQSQAVRQVGE